MTIVELSMERFETITAFFKSVFTAPPWNDDWSDENQLKGYITDLAGNPNSLVFGLFDGETLSGLSIGSVKHRYTGTEYCIDEFCIATDKQHRELGTLFMKEIEKELSKRGIHDIFLQTERGIPAYDFYLKYGFTELSDHVSFAKGVTIDNP